MHLALCPSDATLSDLIQGSVGELQESPVVEHIQQCDECRHKLSQLEASGSDSLLEQLRHPASDTPFFHEPDCHWATTLALGAIAGTSGEETNSEPFQLPLDLGDYRLLEVIAHGGMGIVYRAQHLRLGREVAVKIISGKRLADKRATQRFEAEMRALGQLSHPNIVSALDARELSGQPVLIMEYVDGLDLSQIVDRLGPLTPEAVAAIGRATAAALEYANRNGLVHRDVKPSNIMLNRSGEVKLLDLGLARFQLAPGSEGDGTATGLALGTADYMSPEQIHDARNVDIRADLYSLGCTLYKLLTGSAPYSGANCATNFAKLSAHVSSARILVPEAFKQRSPKVAAVIEKLTAKNRDERPSSAQEVALQLEPFSSQVELSRLVQMACSVGPLAAAPESCSPTITSSTVKSDRAWPPRWFLMLLTLGGVPFGVLLGVWLSIKRPDGTMNRISLPSNANATVDAAGNVAVELPAVPGDSPIQSQAIINSAIDAANEEADEIARHQDTPSAKLQSQAIINSAIDAANEEADAIADREDMATAQIQTADENQPDVVVDPNIGTSGDREVDAAMKAVTEATSPIYRGYPFDAWLNLFEKDRNVDIAISAATALVNLADTPEQKKTVAKAMLKRSRIWGGRFTEGGGFESSSTWMKMFIKEYPKIMHDASLEVLIDEIEQGNINSRIACQMILSTKFDSWFPKDWYWMDVNPNRPLLERLVRVLITEQENKPDQSRIDYDIESTRNLAMAIALNAKIPFHDFPAPLSEIAKKQWDRMIMPTNEIYRLQSIQRILFTERVQEICWLPYWKTLPQNERRPLHVLYQLFQDQAHREPLLDSQHIMDSLPALTDDELFAVKQFLVQRLADSDFDDRESKTKLWPSIVNWLERVDALSQDESSELLKIVKDTEDQAMRFVESEIHRVCPARQICGTFGIGGSAPGMPIVEIKGRDHFPADTVASIEKVLQEGCRQLIELFTLQDNFEHPYRIPGGTAASQKWADVKGLGGGGGQF